MVHGAVFSQAERIPLLHSLLNTMLAYFNQMSFSFMLLASGCYALGSWLCGPRAFFALLAVEFVIVPWLFAFSYPSVRAFIGRLISLSPKG